MYSAGRTAFSILGRGLTRKNHEPHSIYCRMQSFGGWGGVGVSSQTVGGGRRVSRTKVELFAEWGMVHIHPTRHTHERLAIYVEPDRVYPPSAVGGPNTSQLRLFVAR